MNTLRFSLSPVPQPTTVVSVTKLRQPALPPRLLSRRLIQQVQGQQRHRLVAVSAPAGYGKTTFGALWLQNISDPHFSAWLSLDTDDDNPIRLLLCLAAALAPVVPEAAATATDLAGHQPPRQTLLLLLDALDAVALPVYIAIDDLHRLQDPAVHDLLAAALERSAENVHWLLISRHVLPFSLGKLRLQDQVLEIGLGELQLEREEIAELLALNSDLPVAAVDIEVLAERTQGWIAGILLALLSLRRQDASRQRTHTLLDHVRGDNVLLADYLTGELLAHQSEQMRRFLLQCSVAQRLHPGLCDAITGNTNGALLLQQAADARLFLRPLDEHGEWYELHHLFRELLLRRLQKQYAPEIVGELHVRAGGWLLQQGDMMGGLQMLVAGGAAGQAADLVQRHARQALLNNQQQELRRWTDLLPPEQINARPQLLIDLAWLYVLSDMAAYTALVERSGTVLAALATTPDWQAELAVIQLMARVMGGDHTGVFDDAVVAAAQLLETEHHFARGWAAMAAALRAQTQSTITLALHYTQVAADAFAAAAYAEGELYALSLQMVHHVNRGAAQAGLDACTRAFQILRQQNGTSHAFRPTFPLWAGLVLYWQDRIEEAEHCLAEAQQASEQYGDVLCLLHARSLLHLCHIARGQEVVLTPAMLEEEEQLWQRGLETASLGHKTAPVEWQILLWLALDKPARAWSTFRRLDLLLDTIPDDTFPACWMALLTAYTRCGRELDRLTPVLEAHLARREQAGAVYDTIRIRLLMASQQQQLGRHAAARVALRRALRDIEMSGYVRMLFNHPELTSALRSVGTTFAQKMLQQMDSQKRVAEKAAVLSQEDSSALAALSGQEMAVLALFARGLDNNAIAAQLVVTPVTIKWHLGNIYKKLNVKNRRQAIAIFRSAQSSPS